MVRHRHQHMLVVGDTEKPCPQRDLGRQVKRVTRRRVDGLTQPVLPASRVASTTCHPKSARSGGTTSCWGIPSGAANRVRRLSWRPTTSASAAPNASASSRPPSRNATAMLYTGEGPCNWSRNHNRCWANDNGTTAGRSPATNGASPPPPPTDTGRQPGHRGRLEHRAHRKTGIQAGVDRGDHPHRRQRIPTQIEERVVHPDPLHPQHLGIDAGQDLLGRAGRGAVPIAIRCTPVPAGRGCRVCR